MNETRLRNYWRLNMLSTGSALLIALLLLLGYHGITAREDVRKNLIMQGRLLGANVTAAVVFEDARTATEILATVEASPIILEAAVYRADGSRMAHFRREGTDARLEASAPPYAAVFSPGDLRLAVPVQLDGRTVGSIALRATLEDLYGHLGRIFVSMLLIVAVSAALGSYISRRMRLRMAAAEGAIERMALYDRVTGLANRHAFELSLSQTLQRHARDGGGSALLFIDVDGFKKVNDVFGHQIGDVVLKAVGERLGRQLRAADIVARIGGDEFAVILTNTSSPGDAARVAANLVRSAAEPFDAGEATANVGFSIGICMVPHDGADAASALHNADLAMYEAKRSGKGTHRFFAENIGDMARRELDIETGLRQALAGDGLYVVYQAQRSLRSGRIEGLEALGRWRHPVHGAIAPQEFIRVAEEAGLIQDLGRRVLEHVCRDIAELRGKGCVVPPVAVNVSPLQVTQGTIAADIRAALSRFDLTPQALRLEMTERAFIENLHTRVSVLEEIAATGVDIAIDDFGIGYSSLAYLRQLPVAILKIDMRFIHGLPDDAEALAIVKGIVAMGHAIDLRLVAEGVESARQAECLKEIGCDLLQGYHIGLPMPKDKLVAMLASVGDDVATVAAGERTPPLE